MLECLVVCTKPLKHTHSHRRERTTTVTLIFIPVQIVHGLKIGKRTCYFIVCVCVWLRTACSRIVIATIRACGTSKVANKNSNMKYKQQKENQTHQIKRMFGESEREMPHSMHMHWRYQRRKTKHKTHEIKRFIHTYMRPTIKREKKPYYQQSRMLLILLLLI